MAAQNQTKMGGFMPRILFKATVGLTALVLSAGLAIAAPTPDPMQALQGRPAALTPMDPMSALRAPAKAEAGQPAGNAEFGGLPDGPGVEETYFQCVACHSTEIIKQQRLTDGRWDELWHWMTDSQGMVDPDPETKAIILTYLKTHFSSGK